MQGGRHRIGACCVEKNERNIIQIGKGPSIQHDGGDFSDLGSTTKQKSSSEVDETFEN